MDWSLLAGGLSQSATDTLAGANQGLRQAEGIRAGRADEAMRQQQGALQGQQFGLQTEQFKNNLLNQAFQRWMGEQQLGLQKQRAEATDAYHRALLGKYASQLGLEQEKLAAEREMTPYKQREAAARAGYYEARPEFMEERNRLTEDLNRIRERGVDIKEERYRQMHDEALMRNSVALGRLEAYRKSLGNKISPQANMQYKTYMSKLRDIRQKIAIAARQEEFKLPPIPGFILPELRAEQEELNEMIQGLVNQQGVAPGTVPSEPPDVNALRRQFGY